MLTKDELWLVEELSADEPPDLLTIPEIRQYVAHDLRDDELGLWSLTERPEALSKALLGGGRKHPRRARDARAAA
jgi:hypothetical protein